MILEKFTFNETGNPGIELQGNEVSMVTPGSMADDLGIKSGWTIYQMNDKFVTPKDIDGIFDSRERYSITFQVISIEKFQVLMFIFKTQPLEKRVVWLRRCKLTSTKNAKLQMIRKQFPTRLTYCMTINKSQGKFFVIKHIQ